MSPPRLDQTFVRGSIETPVGTVPKASTIFSLSDRLGACKVRWGIGRLSYTVDPGLYAIGGARPESPVFVTANYKMTFDLLRRALAGVDGWILVLDTQGINVWCAAGKGTFGTDELVERIESSRLPNVVTHRRLIVPQLGAPGVSAHEVRQRTGFQVIYGPIRADDLTAFLKGGLKATGEMRVKEFPFAERLALVPIEIVAAVKWTLFVAAVLYLVAFFISGFSPSKATDLTLPAVLALGVSILAGGALTPILLPWLPGRAFSTKGFCMGLLLALCVLLFNGFGIPSHAAIMVGGLAQLVSIPAIAAFLAMNFTGCSTFTSLSGVQKEMRLALPLAIGGMGLGLVLWIAAAAMGG
ncbi:MAG TPA: acetyl-CoA synthase subunit gamma [Deltaproteobacteria bacterium]|nr:acetyl-CoA synthase subunit gamma [Deltaproteobacteria bacterium]